MSSSVTNTPDTSASVVLPAGNTSTSTPRTSGNPTDTTSTLSSQESSWCGSICDKIVSFFTAIFHIITCNCFSQSEQTPPENETDLANAGERVESRVEEAREAGAAALARRPAATQAAEYAVEMRIRFAEEARIAEAARAPLVAAAEARIAAAQTEEDNTAVVQPIQSEEETTVANLAERQELTREQEETRATVLAAAEVRIAAAQIADAQTEVVNPSEWRTSYYEQVEGLRAARNAFVAVVSELETPVEEEVDNTTAEQLLSIEAPLSPEVQAIVNSILRDIVLDSPAVVSSASDVRLIATNIAIQFRELQSRA